MAQAFTPGLQILSNTLVRRIRELPLTGEVDVKVGEMVSSDTIVLRAALPGDLVLVRGPEELGVDAEEFQQLLKVEEGQQIAEGALIAEFRAFFGLLHSVLRSPASGTIEFIAPRTGHIGIRQPPRPMAVKAYVSGKVVAVDKGRSVTVETPAALIQGIFGVGGERVGTLRMLRIEPDAEITPDDIPTDCSGCILVGGARPTIESLRKAAAQGAKGLVTASIDDQCLKSYLGYDLGIALTGDEDVPMTVIITEGFGRLPMSPRVLEVLRQLDGRAASMSGVTQVRAGAVRPELVVPREADGSSRASQEPLVLKEGSRVRLIRFPYFGLFADVLSLPSKPERIATGAVTRVLRARLADGKVITVPRANVELVG